jgi:CheY-like chemotaxis protein
MRRFMWSVKLLLLKILPTLRGSRTSKPSAVQIETGATFDLLGREFDTHARALFSAMSDLSSTELSSPQRRQILSLRRSLEQLNTLQQDSIQFMRMVSKNYIPQEGPVALEELVWEICTPLVTKFMGQETEFVCSIASGVPAEVRCNRELFSILLQHLLEHATAVTVRGEVTLSLTVEQLPSKQDLLVLTVADSGSGIAREQLDSAFLPFALPQGPNGRRLATSGLALTLCREAAQLLQGTLHLSSVEGRGSTIAFKMPLTHAVRPKSDSPATRQVGCELPQTIVIDDSKGNLRLLRTLLEQEGRQVFTFESPREALQFLRDSRETNGAQFDHLFLDDSIEDFDFAALTRFIASNRTIIRRAVLMTHDVGTPSRPRRISEPGFDTLLPKPIRRADLLCVLANEPIPVRKRTTTVNTGDKPDANRASRQSVLIEPVNPMEPAQGETRSVSTDRQSVCLVVDDNLVNMHTVSSLLRTKNVEVLLAENGKEAVEIFASARQVDVILMDLQMPEMDGYEATRRIRQIERDKQRHTPIIALTAFSTRSEQERCITTGMDGFLPKPVHASELFDLLKNYSIGFETAAGTTVSDNMQAH